jgi:hypothetical protein
MQQCEISKNTLTEAEKVELPVWSMPVAAAIRQKYLTNAQQQKRRPIQ